MAWINWLKMANILHIQSQSSTSITAVTPSPYFSGITIIMMQTREIWKRFFHRFNEKPKTNWMEADGEKKWEKILIRQCWLRTRWKKKQKYNDKDRLNREKWNRRIEKSITKKGREKFVFLFFYDFFISRLNGKCLTKDEANTHITKKNKELEEKKSIHDFNGNQCRFIHSTIITIIMIIILYIRSKRLSNISYEANDTRTYIGARKLFLSFGRWYYYECILLSLLTCALFLVEIWQVEQRKQKTYKV